MWYDDQGGSTYICQANSNATLLNGTVNLVYDFRWTRATGVGYSDVAGRGDFAIGFLATLAQSTNACFVCGLVRHNKGCFPPGVQVAMQDGTTFKKVEDIAAGDLVWNPLVQKSFRVLTVTEGPEENPLIVIRAGNIVLKVSGEHPVLTEEGLKQAKQLHSGDIIQDSQLAKYVIDRVHSEQASPGLTVINFVLERDGSKLGGLLVADGVVVGDLAVQKELSVK